jgi:hypothetical protein
MKNKLENIKRFRKIRNRQKTIHTLKCFCVVETSFLIDVLDEKYQRFFWCLTIVENCASTYNLSVGDLLVLFQLFSKMKQAKLSFYLVKNYLLYEQSFSFISKKNLKRKSMSAFILSS